MKIFLFCLALFSTSQPLVYAQSDQPSVDAFEYKNTVSIVPQYLFVSGLRVDYERQLKNENKWLVFAPQVYYNDKPNGELNFNFDYDRMTGFGMNIYFKQFFSHSEKKNAGGSARTNVYFSVGPTFQYFNLINGNVTTEINKFGGNFNLGLQFAFGRFLLDLYGGVGFRYSVDSEGKYFDQDNSYWVSFGYSGILFDGGLRLGYYFL